MFAVPTNEKKKLGRTAECLTDELTDTPRVKINDFWVLRIDRGFRSLLTDVY